MKFAAPYQLHSCPIDYDNIDEFNIVFLEDSSWEKLDEFINLYPSKRINIQFKCELNILMLAGFAATHENIYVRLTSSQLPQLKDLQDKKIKFFFDSSLSIYSYSLLDWALKNGSTDIYIVEDLIYNLSNIKIKCDEYNVKLRIILNKLPYLNEISSSIPTAQIFTPRDYELLDKYFEVGEFDFGDKYDWTKAKVMYKKWYIKHDWNDDAKYLNGDISIPYPTQSIPPELSTFRTNCQYRCISSKYVNCKKCARLIAYGWINDAKNYTYPKDVDNSLDILIENIGQKQIIISEDDK